jgi:aminopeptidase N
LQITAVEQDFTFQNIEEPPIPSLLREFSAPGETQGRFKRRRTRFFDEHDSDDFNRWEASQQLAIKIMTQLVADYQHNRPLQVPDTFTDAYQEILQDDSLDKALVTQAITLPSGRISRRISGTD